MHKQHLATPLPPAPDLSIEAQTFAWYTKPYEFARQCADELGPIFSLHLRGWDAPHVVVSEPDAIRDVFRGSARTFLASESNASLLPLFGPQSMFTQDSAAHLRLRRMLLPAFQWSKLIPQGRITQELTQRAIAEWPMDGTVSLQPLLLDLTMSLILQAIFGFRADDPALRQIEPILRQMLRIGHSGHSGAAGSANGATSLAARKQMQLVADFDRLIFAHIERRRAQRGRPNEDDGDDGDVLGAMLEARDDDGRPLSPRELRDQLVTLMIAGHETTGSALAWTLVLLESHPEIAARLEQELAGADTGDPQVVAQLPYLDAICHESLRLRPVISATSRVVGEPASLGGYALPVGVYVLVHIYLAHHRAETYPDPDRFRPERFLERAYSAYEYLPFGGGTRRCIGMSFALLQMKVILATIAKSLHLKSAARRPVRGVRRNMLAVGPSEGAAMELTPRQGSLIPLQPSIPNTLHLEKNPP